MHSESQPINSDFQLVTHKEPEFVPRTTIEIYPGNPVPLPFEIDLSKLELDHHAISYPIDLDAIGIILKGIKGGDIYGVVQAKTGNNPYEFPPFSYPVGKAPYLLDQDPKTGLLIAREVPVSVTVIFTDVPEERIFVRSRAREKTRLGIRCAFLYDKKMYKGAATYTQLSGETNQDSGRLEVNRWFDPDKTVPTNTAMQIPSDAANRFFTYTPFVVNVHNDLLDVT